MTTIDITLYSDGPRIIFEFHGWDAYVFPYKMYRYPKGRHLRTPVVSISWFKRTS